MLRLSESVCENIKRMTLTLDSKAAVFDVPSESVEMFLSAAGKERLLQCFCQQQGGGVVFLSAASERLNSDTHPLLGLVKRPKVPELLCQVFSPSPLT